MPAELPAVQTDQNDPDCAAGRYVRRNAIAQAPGFTQALVKVGWRRHRLNGSSAIVRRGKWGMFARMEHGPIIDARAIVELARAVPLKRFLVEPAAVGRIVDRFGASSGFEYTPGQEDAWLAPFLDERWVVSRRPIAHSKTFVVDLADGPETALGRANESTRRKVRRGLEHEGLELLELPFDEVDEELVDEVHALYQSFLSGNPSLRDQWPFRRALFDTFGENGRLLGARLEGNLVAAVMLLMHDGVGAYFAAFSSPEAKEVNGSSLLVAETMRAAHDAGCDLLDLIAAWDERYPERDEGWRGFTSFKERFRPAAVYFPPALEAIPPPASAT